MSNGLANSPQAYLSKLAELQAFALLKRESAVARAVSVYPGRIFHNPTISQLYYKITIYYTRKSLAVHSEDNNNV